MKKLEQRLYPILDEHNITVPFPPKAAEQALALPAEVAEKDLRGRRNLTDQLIITIDGDDAKDFDDAVQVTKTADSGYRLGVHIADVSHYVTEGSPLDQAAFDRGTSVYLIDSVVPMLPEELSNELCSLKPHVIRLTLSVFMDFDSKGELLRYEIAESYIRSCHRMTYGDVTEMLEGKEKKSGALREKYADIYPMLLDMRELAELLHRRRVRRGALEFVSRESLIRLDKKGIPTSVKPYPSGISNHIIEEFMIVCNETVAEHLGKQGLPLVYRVHEAPGMNGMERLNAILPMFGIPFRMYRQPAPKDFQQILDAVKGKDEESAIHAVVLRSMSKAKYSEHNCGHFGLASKNYCHFTSPIRRYPDLVVHRILRESLHGQPGQDRIAKLNDFCVSAALSSTIAELEAAEAERDWKQYKKALYMKKRIGKEYEGTITHILNSGFFVELDNTVEGFVPARALEDDIYFLSENQVMFEAAHYDKRYIIGDRLKIKVKAVDVALGQIDFVISREPKRNRSVKTKKGKYNRMSRLDPALKDALYREKSERMELRRDMEEQTEKIDFEIEAFCNAVRRAVSEKIFRDAALSKSAKKLVNHRLEQMAVSVAAPLRHEWVSAARDGKLKETQVEPGVYIINAVTRMRNTLEGLQTNLELELAPATYTFAEEYITKALQLLAESIPAQRISVLKRLDEYAKL